VCGERRSRADDVLRGCEGLLGSAGIRDREDEGGLGAFRACDGARDVGAAVLLDRSAHQWVRLRCGCGTGPADERGERTCDGSCENTSMAPHVNPSSPTTGRPPCG